MDNKAFKELYKNFALPLTKFIIKKIGGDQDVVDEIFSQTIISAWKGFNTFKNKSSYFTWICKIALNKIADYYREQIHENSLFVAPFFDSLAEKNSQHLQPDEKLALEELRYAVRECINLLPEDKRNLIYLRYWKDLTISQIARITGLSERSVEGKIYRAKKALKSIFEENYENFSKEYIR